MSEPFVDDFDDDVTVAARPPSAAVATSRMVDDFDDDVTVAARPAHGTATAVSQVDSFDDDVTVAASQTSINHTPAGQAPDRSRGPLGLSTALDAGQPIHLPTPPPTNAQWRPPTRLSGETINPPPETSQRAILITVVAVAAISIMAATFAAWFLLTRSSDENEQDQACIPYQVELGDNATQS